MELFYFVIFLAGKEPAKKCHGSWEDEARSLKAHNEEYKSADYPREEDSK